MVFRNWAVAQGTVLSIFLLITGIIIPVTIFPDVVEVFARLLPITNGLFAVRDAFAGAPLSEVSGAILREAITGLTYYVITYAGLLVFEYIVRKTGTLDRVAL